MNGEERKTESFSWMRRWSAALNLIVTVAAVVALVAMFNYLAVRHFTRFHWNRDIEGELSPRTRTVLASLTNTVKVIVYFKSEDPLFPRIKGLLKEYEIATRRVQVQYVDYFRDSAAARKVKLDYKLTSVNDKNVIIFDANDRSVVVNEGELSDYDTSELLSGKTNAVYRTHFKGELLFTSKIFAVANARSPVAYYLLGNGEHPPGNVDSPESYAKFLSLLRNENNFNLYPLLLTGTNEVPSTCNLLIVAGPTQPLDRTELDKIQHYLEQGGRMLVAFNNATVNGRPTGVERLLAKWGVDVGNDWVVDRENSINGELDVIPVDLGRHQIVNALQRSSRVHLYRPRSIRAVRPASRGDETRVDELLLTGPDTIVFTDSREPDRTQKGPKPLMVAVEKSVSGLQRGSTRLVVLGDSTIWANQFIELAANREFAALTANWLVNQSVLLGDIPRRAINTYKLTMTRGQLRSVQLILLAGMPGAVLLIGLLVWLRRRH